MPGYISKNSKTQKNTHKFITEDEEKLSSSLEDQGVSAKRRNQKSKTPNKRSTQKVCLEGYVDPKDDSVLPRTKSLTDDDLDELKGCVDLGFGFSYDEIPELCTTLPALELCYSMSHKFLDEQHCNGLTGGEENSDSVSVLGSGYETSSSMPTWKISSPGDDPEDVKARLKFWAQAVACTVKLCNNSS